MSRLLVLLTTVLLLVMPVTEHLCNWDRFLRGGPDVEFNLLAWLLFAAMVVLSMHGTMLRPTMMQPGMMQPTFVATIAQNDRAAAPGALVRNGAWRSFDSFSSRSLSLGSNFDCGMKSRKPVPLRI